MTNTTLIVVGDQGIVSDALHRAIRSKGCSVETFSDVGAGITRMRRRGVLAALVHFSGGIKALHVARFLFEMARLDDPVATIISSDHFDADESLSFLKMGAAECLCLPLDSNRLSMLLDLILARRLVASQSPTAEDFEDVSNGTLNDGFFFGSKRMQSLCEQVQRVAPLETTILLTGETGTGKTRLAKLVHQLSPRAAKPFLVVNCGVLSSTLVESELFGHVRGAFTGADKDRSGKFAQAQDGTLLLDDVDSMSPSTQAKLLRAVEDRMFEPVGADCTSQVRARLIAATNRSLEEEMKAGRFRSDLYYRLNVVAFHLPPLRDRSEEIPQFVERFIDEAAQRYRLRPPPISAATMAAIESYQWPGNVRELRNIIERAVILCTGSCINPDVLPDRILNQVDAEQATAVAELSPATNQLVQARISAERTQLLDSLRRNDNNRTHTAADLGISRAALYKKLHRFGLA